MSVTRKSIVLLISTFVVYGVLVAINEGEFWPFSIYPMFSQAGTPWSRTIVRETPPSTPVAWDTVSIRGLPGEPYSLLDHGVDPIDLSNFLSKTEHWNDKRVQALQKMFAEGRGEMPELLVFRVNGRLAAEDSIALQFIPYAHLSIDNAIPNPALRQQRTQLAPEKGSSRTSLAHETD